MATFYSVAVDDELSLGLLEPRHAPVLRDLWARNAERLAAVEPWAARPGALDDPAAWLSFAAQRWAAGQAWSHVLLRDGEAVGTCAVMATRPERSVSIGYLIDRDHEGHGLVTRAVSHLVRWVFAEQLADRVEIGAAVSNTRSRAVPERLSFTFEGVQRGGLVFPDHRVDRAVYSRLATDG